MHTATTTTTLDTFLPTGLGTNMLPACRLADLAANDVVAQLPRYAAPNIASALPTYRNGEQEFIQRTFATGNYDMIRHLPASLREQQVSAEKAGGERRAGVRQKRHVTVPVWPRVTGAPKGSRQSCDRKGEGTVRRVHRARMRGAASAGATRSGIAGKRFSASCSLLVRGAAFRWCAQPCDARLEGPWSTGPGPLTPRRCTLPGRRGRKLRAHSSCPRLGSRGCGRTPPTSRGCSRPSSTYPRGELGAQRGVGA